MPGGKSPIAEELGAHKLPLKVKSTIAPPHQPSGGASTSRLSVSRSSFPNVGRFVGRSLDATVEQALLTALEEATEKAKASVSALISDLEATNKEVLEHLSLANAEKDSESERRHAAEAKVQQVYAQAEALTKQLSQAEEEKKAQAAAAAGLRKGMEALTREKDKATQALAEARLAKAVSDKRCEELANTANASAARASELNAQMEAQRAKFEEILAAERKKAEEAHIADLAAYKAEAKTHYKDELRRLVRQVEDKYMKEVEELRWQLEEAKGDAEEEDAEASEDPEAPPTSLNQDQGMVGEEKTSDPPATTVPPEVAPTAKEPGSGDREVAEEMDAEAAQKITPGEGLLPVVSTGGTPASNEPAAMGEVLGTSATGEAQVTQESTSVGGDKGVTVKEPLPPAGQSNETPASTEPTAVDARPDAGSIAIPSSDAVHPDPKTAEDAAPRPEGIKDRSVQEAKGDEDVDKAVDEAFIDLSE